MKWQLLFDVHIGCYGRSAIQTILHVFCFVYINTHAVLLCEKKIVSNEYNRALCRCKATHRAAVSERRLRACISVCVLFVDMHNPISSVDRFFSSSSFIVFSSAVCIHFIHIFARLREMCEKRKRNKNFFVYFTMFERTTASIEILPNALKKHIFRVMLGEWTAFAWAYLF